MGKKYRDLVAQRSNAKSGSLFVLYVMASWASDKGECSLTIGHLASDTRMSDRGVQKAIKKLVEIGEIEVISAGYGAGNKPTWRLLHEELTDTKGEQNSPFDNEQAPEKGEQSYTVAQKGEQSSANEAANGAKKVNSETEKVNSETEKGELCDDPTIYGSDIDLLDRDSERTPAQDEPTATTVSEMKPEAPAPVIEEPPVPEKPVRISRADQLNAQVALNRAQLPDEIYDPPSKAGLRLRAAQAALPDVPPPSKRKPEVDKTYIKQRLSSEGYIKVGTGTTAVEVYYERFSAYDAEAKLTAPLQDDLVSGCTDLAKLRTVVEEYSRRPYKARNIKLILEWYSKGIPDNGNGNGRPNSTQSNQQRPANERRALGKAPVIDRNEAKRLFANHPIYANQPQ